VRQTPNDSRFVEDNRHGRGLSSYIHAELALMGFIDFMAANNDVFPSFDHVSLVIRSAELSQNSALRPSGVANASTSFAAVKAAMSHLPGGR